MWDSSPRFYGVSSTVAFHAEYGRINLRSMFFIHRNNLVGLAFVTLLYPCSGFQDLILVPFFILASMTFFSTMYFSLYGLSEVILKMHIIFITLYTFFKNPLDSCYFCAEP